MRVLPPFGCGMFQLRQSVCTSTCAALSRCCNVPFTATRAVLVSRVSQLLVCLAYGPQYVMAICHDIGGKGITCSSQGPTSNHRMARL